MPLFHFVLKAGRHAYPDSEGQEFADQASAVKHAQAVARELMRNRENKTGHWRIQVCDDYLQPRREYLFADIDDTLDRFDADSRAWAKAMARTTAAIGDSVRPIDTAMSDLRQMITRIDSIMSSCSPRLK
jgi:hypothetical protein